MKKITTLCLSLLIAMAGMADEWTLVTDASDLQAGDQIVIGYVGYNHTASTSITSGNTKAMTAVTSTFDDAKITSLGEGSAVFTLGGKAGEWTLTEETKGLLVATAAKKLQWGGTGTSTWAIIITDDGQAAINSTTSEYGRLQYNYNQGNARFGVYTSLQKPVEIYRLGDAKQKVNISYQGFPYRKTACEEPTYKEGTTYTLPTYVPKNEQGKKLKAWSFGGETYAPGASFTVPATDVEFVPVWDGDATDIDHVAEAVKAVKILRDGQLIIVRDGAEYNIIGTRVK